MCAALVETMAYNKAEVPWHQLGVPVDDNLTTDEMLVAAGLDWQVIKKPLYFPWEANEDGLITMKRAHGQSLLIRDTDQKILSMVGDDWNENQNKDVFEFFRRYVEAGHMRMETAGSLKGGKFIWCLAALDKDFELVTGDKIGGYVLLCSPHAFGFRFTIQCTSIRVVCNNTLTYSLREGPQAGTQAFRMTHARKFDADAQREAEETIGLALKRFDWVKEISEKLANHRVTYEDRIEYFKRVAKIEEVENDGEDTSTDDELPRIVRKFETAFLDAPGTELSSAKDTLFGAVNAVTYTVDHELGRTADNRLFNAWFGSNASMKRRAIDFAVELADAT
jgi:phage/plasmid-like protein (TIGR03299 family)